METIRTFTAFCIFNSSVNITVELITNDEHYEIRETHTGNNNKEFTTVLFFDDYSEAKTEYDNLVNTINLYA